MSEGRSSTVCSSVSNKRFQYATASVMHLHHQVSATLPLSNSDTGRSLRTTFCLVWYSKNTGDSLSSITYTIRQHNQQSKREAGTSNPCQCTVRNELPWSYLAMEYHISFLNTFTSCIPTNNVQVGKHLLVCTHIAAIIRL